MKHLIAILLIMFAVQGMAQDLNSAYKEYCTEGVKMFTDSTEIYGTVIIEVTFDGDQIKYGKRDTAWWGADMLTFSGNITRGGSCLNSRGGIWNGGDLTDEVPRIKINGKSRESKPIMTNTFKITKMKYQDYYYKEDKMPFEKWLRSKNYLK